MSLEKTNKFFIIINNIILYIQSLVSYYIYPGPSVKNWPFNLHLIVTAVRLRQTDLTSSFEDRRKALHDIPADIPKEYEVELLEIKQYHRDLAKQIIYKQLNKTLFKHGLPKGRKELIVEHIYNNNNNKVEDYIIYAHGGAFYINSPKRSRPFAVELIKNNGAHFICPAYSLSPENEFPSALIDLFSTYLFVKDTFPKYKNIIIAGDSSGGNLALSLLYIIRDNQYEIPSGCFLFSPWLDLKCDYDSYIINSYCDVTPHHNFKGEDFVNLTNQDFITISDSKLAIEIQERGHYYCKKVLLGHKLVSPIQEEDFSNLPPILIVF